MLTSKLNKHLVWHAGGAAKRLGVPFGSATKQNIYFSAFLEDLLSGKRKLQRDSIQNDSKLLLNELLKQKSHLRGPKASDVANDGLEMENINKILTKLDGAGFFDNTELSNLQMFLDWADLSTLSKRAQTQLYRSLLLFLNESKYSLLIKYGVCMQMLQLVDKQPSFLRVSGLYEYPLEFMFDKCATLSLYEIVILYTKGQVLKLLSLEEISFLEERVLEEFQRLRTEKLNPFKSCTLEMWLEFVGYLAVQRYRELETRPESPRYSEFTQSQTLLLQQIILWLASSRDWSSRIDLRK